MGFLELCVFVLAITYVTFGQRHCWKSNIQSQMSDYGQVMEYCDYEYVANQKARRIKLLPGSEMKTSDCVTCVCNGDGLACCTGDALELHMRQNAPIRCEVAVDGCEIYYVMAGDYTRDCFTGETIRLRGFLHPPLLTV